MAVNVRLFINDREVEFSTDPNVLYTYQETDLTNPTAVKNSFSKTVTIEGTPNNNDIFGHYWNIERYLLNGGVGGAFFNSSKKVPFQLFVGSDLYEEGYAKLDTVQRSNGILRYNITLYGGLGDFFWNLSTTDDGNEKKLSDLVYMDGGGEDEFNFTANIDTVNTAWGVLKGTVNPNFSNNKKWQHINFMPAYNGIPSDFDADKIVINTSGTTIQKGAKNADDDKWYYVKNGWTIGTLPEEMTEWDVRDLRSYLQRPVIKMSSIINACCNPDNNGGYTVDLDPDFFSQDNDYWTKTYLTLPQVQNLEYNNEEQILEGAELLTATTTGSTTGLMYQNLRFDLGQINSNVSNITLKCNIKTHAGWSNSSFIWFWNWNGDSAHPNWICFGSLFCQLIALNGDTVVGASQVYNLTTPIRHNGNLYYGHNGHYPEASGYDSNTGRKKMENGSQYIPYMDQPIYNVLGKFSTSGFKAETGHTSSSSTYSDTPYEFTFNINNINGSVTALKMVYYWGASEKKVKREGANYLFSTTYCDAWVSLSVAAESVTVSDLSLNITDHNMSAVLGESLGRTGTKVTKALLLNTESSPCDYLLSYCKMFGLHFVKEVGTKTIHLMTRKTFYNRGNVVDLNDWIDHSKDWSITPIMFKSKWYQFVQEKDESALQQKYITTKGIEYGCKVLDTGYEFNAEKQDLLKDNCIRSGIEGMEKSKWFTAYNNDESLRPWMNLGLKYTLWNGEDTFEYNAGVGNSGTIMPINEGQGLKYYDIIPKLQFHDDGNNPTEGNNCLVFFSGFKSVVSGRTNPLSYILSDDTAYQTDMNEGTPCWLFTKEEVVGGKRLCYKLTSLPVFERYLTGPDSGTIIKSLDFGSAQELYVPNYSLTDDTNIYHSYWRTYLNDLFDVNTKQLTCYVKINDKPGVDWMRRFYWFDNAIWRCNKINDWNPASDSTTKVEFIKVQDIANYTSVSQATAKTITLESSTYEVAYGGGNITLTVTAEAGASWRIGVDNTNISLSRTSGTGTGTVTVHFPANSGDSPVTPYFTATRTDNAYSTMISIRQGYEGEQNLSMSPNQIIVPYSGGSYEFDFIWFNQGTQYITGATSSGTVSVTSIDTTTKQDENKATVVFGTNASDDVKHATITFNSGTESVQLRVDQLPESYTFKGAGETKQLVAYYATGATFTNLPYWLDIIDNGTSTYTMQAIENLYTSADTATVTMTKGTSADFQVILQVQDDWVSPTVLEFAYTGGTGTLTITTDDTWSIVGKPSWITTSVSSGTGNATISVTADTNENFESRVGTIVFYDSTRNKTYLVHTCQADNTGELFSITRQNGSGNVLASGGDVYLYVASNKNPWTVTSNTTACTLSISSASTSAAVTATFAANDGEPRQAILTFTNANGTVKTYTITQEGSNVGSGWVVPGYISFTATGGTADTQTITVNNNNAWQIVAYPNWVTFNPSSGTGSTTVDVVAIPYSGNVDRTGTMVFYDTVTRGTAIVAVSQAAGQGEILAVSPSELRYTHTGGTATLTIIANTDWTIG